MTREEFGVLVASMKAVYTDPKFLPDKTAMDVWYALVKQLDYATAAAAVQAHMMTSPFPPTPADINKQTVEGADDSLDEQKAWDLVWKAICDSTYHSQERFDELPEMCQRAIGSPNNLRAIALSENTTQTVEKSLFLRSYRTIKERAKTEAMIPAKVRETLRLAQTKAGLIEAKEDSE